jgi:hypothetical protein
MKSSLVLILTFTAMFFVGVYFNLNFSLEVERFNHSCNDLNNDLNESTIYPVNSREGYIWCIHNCIRQLPRKNTTKSDLVDCKKMCQKYYGKHYV